MTTKESREARFHVGLTPETVVEAAMDLTREGHLLTWSIRDLSSRLGVAPAAVYHHVGGKDLLCKRVVDRVLGHYSLPEEGLAWQVWFRELLDILYPVVTEYPGVAKWMMMHGPTIPAVLPTLETGMGLLREAGFGDRATFAYSLLLNNAMLTISIGDDRLQHEGDGARDHAAMMHEFLAVPTESAEVRAIGDEFIRPFAEGSEVADRIRREYYDFMVGATIAGLEAWLERSGAGSPSEVF